MLKGITVTLYEKTQSSLDGFGSPIYSYTPTTVQNVLVGFESATDVTASTDLVGKAEGYILGIPKGDTHNWTDAKVVFWGKTWKTTGAVIQGIEDMIPTAWHKKIRVERYE